MEIPNVSEFVISLDILEYSRKNVCYEIACQSLIFQGFLKEFLGFIGYIIISLLHTKAPVFLELL